MNLLEFLSEKKSYPKMYFRDSHAGEERAALGSACVFPSIPNLSSDLCVYGGIEFPLKRKTQLWEGFPTQAFWSPAFEVVQEIEKREAIFEESIRAELTSNSSMHNTWEEQITALLHQMAQTQVDKVVVARTKTFTFSTKPSVWKMVERLGRKVSSGTLFAMQISPDRAFFGISPETLYRREGRTVHIDALAGTRRLGSTELEDLFLERDLRQSLKEQTEFAHVKTFIDSAMKPFSKKTMWEQNDSVLKTTHVQHLHNRARIHLKAGITDAQLLTSLHPTPAVGGYPRDKAHSLIQDFESFDRGWYASPIGWATRQKSHFIVAIRSALLIGSQLHLFAGGGIVPGSIAMDEWEEHEHKMRTLLDGCGLTER